MTIKRRLFIANIMMILSPIILIGLTFLGVRSFLIEGYVPRASGGGMPVGWILAFVYLVIVVSLANLLIATSISKKIMTPLNTLVKGVREIRNGNLQHRIEYHNDDEFDVVCSDFNEMATYLSEMVAKQIADEKSRKELIAGISHDLRTPLTSIKMCVDGFKGGPVLTPEKQEKYIDIIERKANDLEHIIKQLFLFSKLDMGEFPLKLEVVEFGIEVDKVIEDFAHDYGFAEINITMDNSLTDEQVLIDRVQFKNVIQNILSNSLKYANRPDVKVEVICESVNPDFITISLCDNGVGVPEEMLAKIFDVFYRGDDSRNGNIKGSGLGLAISAKTIERFGGWINAENAQDGGLNITITLPHAGGLQS